MIYVIELKDMQVSVLLVLLMNLDMVDGYQQTCGLFLQTWFNLNTSMDKQLHPL